MATVSRSVRPVKSNRFQVLIVEDRGHGKASLAPVGFSSDDRQLAELWAKTFNRGELADPVDAWAIVKGKKGGAA